MLQTSPDDEGDPLSGDVEELIEEREVIEEYLDERLSAVQTIQKKGEITQGDSFSKEQETLIQYLQHLRNNSSGELHDPVGEVETVSERAEQLRNRLTDVKLRDTDEDRILRERFRDHPEYDRISDWPVEELFNEIESFLDDVIGSSTEYQETLVKADDVHARILCWGVVRAS
jgi:hypothetical protein